MNRCVNCSTEIPDGKHFCKECWDAEMQKYREYKAEYDAKLAEWKSMSPEERAARNGEVNEKSLRKRTISLFVVIALVPACIGGIIVDNPQPNLSKAYILFGLAAIVLIAGIILAIKSALFRHIFGKAFSLLLGAVLGALVGGSIAYFVVEHYGWLGTVSTDVIGQRVDLFSNLTRVQWFSLGACLVIPTLLGGFIGFRHTGKVKFTPPKMPSQSRGEGAVPGEFESGSWFKHHRLS